MARFLSISSGSNGNCYYIGDERTALIVDAGVGFRTVKSRLAGADVDIASVEMIFVTHDHVDHIRGLASVAQRLSVPVYATARLHDALSRHKAVGPEIGGSRRVLRPGFETEMRGVRCLAFEVPHDATQTLGYRLDFFGTSFVFMTDLGKVPEYAYDMCAGADYLVIESNYDLDMLMGGSYPPDLKARIVSDCGHLSNSGIPVCAASSSAISARTTIPPNWPMTPLSAALNPWACPCLRTSVWSVCPGPRSSQWSSDVTSRTGWWSEYL